MCKQQPRFPLRSNLHYHQRPQAELQLPPQGLHKESLHTAPGQAALLETVLELTPNLFLERAALLEQVETLAEIPEKDDSQGRVCGFEELESF